RRRSSARWRRWWRRGRERPTWRRAASGRLGAGRWGRSCARSCRRTEPAEGVSVLAPEQGEVYVLEKVLHGLVEVWLGPRPRRRGGEGEDCQQPATLWPVTLRRLVERIRAYLVDILNGRAPLPREPLRVEFRASRQNRPLRSEALAGNSLRHRERDVRVGLV